ncbi:MAG: ABC transporter permease [Rubrobacter sp.]|nr:ABC transporter permease [Rubrobacter sp.]
MREFNAVLTIAYRDVAKFTRDRTRLVASLIFPVIFVAVLGGSLQANIGDRAGYDFLVFTFTGVFAQTLFLSATQGVISLVEDRENDFSQEIFVSPISRYSIILGKIVGESIVALVQGVVVVLFGLVIGVPLTLAQIVGLLPVAVAACLLGGAFGVFVLGNISSQRAANQIFPFVIFPQFFLAGVFSPIQVLPLPLDVLSRISPLRYAVDLTRNRTPRRVRRRSPGKPLLQPRGDRGDVRRLPGGGNTSVHPARA